MLILGSSFLLLGFLFLLINPLWSFYLCLFIAGSYVTSWHEFKIPFKGFLINPFDLVFITLFFSFVLRSMIDRTYSKFIKNNLFLLIIITLFYTVFSGILGMINGNRLMDILKDFRIFLFFLSMAYISTFFFKSIRDVALFGKVLIAIGILISIEQIGYFLLHLNITNVWLTRNIAIPAQIIPFSLAYLYCFRDFLKNPIFNKFWLIIAAFFIFAIFISFTRSIYLQTSLTLFLVCVMSSKTPVISIFKIITSLALFVIILSPISKFFLDVNINEGVIRRLSLFFVSSKDLAIQHRWSESVYAFKVFLIHPILGSGLGSRVVFFNPEIQTMEQTLYLENSFLWYLVKFGIIGTVLISWFYFKSFGNIFKFNSQNIFFKKYRAFYFSSMFPFVAIHSFSGNLSYAPFLIFLGLMIGQSMSIYYLEKRQLFVDTEDI